MYSSLIKHLLLHAAAAAVLLSATACHREGRGVLPEDGAQVSFCASTSPRQMTAASKICSGDGFALLGAEPLTKLAYEAITGTSTRERLQWSQGDDIAILMHNDKGSFTHRYYVASGEDISADGDRSSAILTPEGSQGLLWAKNQNHTFVALYPHPASSNLSAAARSKAGLSDHDGSFTGFIPATTVATDADVSRGTVAADLSHAWMSTQPVSVSADDVPAERIDLSFEPRFSAYEITLLPGPNQSIVVSSVSIFDQESEMAGTFVYQSEAPQGGISGSLEQYQSAQEASYGPGCNFVDDGLGSLSIAADLSGISGGGIQVSDGNPLQVTLIALPRDYHKLTISVTAYFGGSLPVTRSLPLKKSGQWQTFAAGKKHRISVNLPAMSEIDANDEVIDWTPRPLTPAGYEFSVSAARKVRFTTANLAYMGATGGDKPWRIMQYPWSLIEGTDGSNTFTPGENIDFALFGWATSGYNGKNPWMTSADPASYGPATDGLWTADSELWDWGVFNTIYDCNALSAVPNLRTLSFAEWDHLLNYRSGTYRFQCASVNATKGLIVFPDGFTPASCPELVQNITTSLCNVPQDFSQVSYSTSQFSQLSNLGAVFLPVTGARNGTNLLPGHGRFYGQPEGFYWTCTGVIESGSNYGAFCLVFDNNDIAPYEGDDYYSRDCGAAVRLVQDILPLTPAGKTFTVSADGRKVQFTTSNLMYAGASDPEPATGLGKFKLMEKPWSFLEGNNAGSADGANQDADRFGWATSGYRGCTPWMTSTAGSDYGPAVTSGSWTSDSDLWDWGQYNTVYAADGETVLSGLRMLTCEEWLYLLEGRNQNHSYLPVTVRRNGSDYAFGLLIAYDEADVSNLPVPYPSGISHNTSWFPASAGGGSSPGPGSSSSTSSISRNLAPSVTFTCEQIDILVADGYLFLPTTASCHGYWTSSAGSSIAADSLDLPYSVVSITVPQARPRYDKCHVRLVKEIVD